MSRYARLLPLLVLVFACSKDNPVGPPVVTSVAVTPGTDTLIALGRTRQFSAVPQDANGNPVTGVTIVWRSSNPSVATVDSATGIVTAVGNGLSVIRADAGGVIGQATLAVVQLVAIVVVSPPSAGFTAVGDTQRLAGVAKDSGGAIVQGVRFVWQSSDQSVATVDTGGLLRSKGPGQTFITAAGRGVPGFAVVTVTQTAARLVFVGTPPNVVAGELFPAVIQVEVRDSNDALITTARNVISIAVGSGFTGNLVGAQSAGAVGGVATFAGLTYAGIAGGHTLIATASGLGFAESGPFLVSPGHVAFLTVTTPDSVDAGSPFQVVANAFDVYGNLATTYPDTIVLTATSVYHGALDRPTAATLVGPTATFDSVVLNSPGNFTITASDHGATGSGPTIAALTFGTVLSAGNAGGCATSSAGLAYCWGGGPYGQLGGGSVVNNSTVPRLVDRSLTFTQLAAATIGHACGLTPAGDAYCWGLNNEGQVGNGIEFTDYEDSVPRLVVGGHKFLELAVGNLHSCGVTTAHEIYCWGDDSRGELGSGKSTTYGFTATPTLVAGGLSWDHVSVSGGFSFSCGLTTTGAAYCWGANEYAQLGDNSTSDDSVPTAVVGGTTFTSIAVGWTQTCAIAAADSTAYCWGTNGIGRAATQIDSVAAPVDGGTRFLGVASGADKSCGTGTDLHVTCWVSSPTPALRVPTLDLAWGTPDVIALGFGFECRLIAGVVSCRGSNYSGQLGDGTYNNNFNTFSETLRIQLGAPAPVARTRRSR
ncbi:MAG TPA: Ig-like domain-containing protein [Gemmatimonadales bacterium]|nr:Ig-like domain-containing protein [Gemmatimonadales bacterium]